MMGSGISVSSRLRSEPLRMISCVEKAIRNFHLRRILLIHYNTLIEEWRWNKSRCSECHRFDPPPSGLPSILHGIQSTGCWKRSSLLLSSFFFFSSSTWQQQTLAASTPHNTPNMAYWVESSIQQLLSCDWPIEQVRLIKCVVSLQANGTKLAASLIWLQPQEVRHGLEMCAGDWL